MSAASRNVQSVIGNTARALPWVAPLEETPTPRRTRTPLSLVVSAPRKRRVPFAAVCFLFLVGALMTVLVLNVQVTSGQYKLVELKEQQAALLKSNQDLTAKVQNAGAPQNLVARAEALGMVTSTTTGQIDVNSKTITGDPKPAVASTKSTGHIAPPAIDARMPDQKPATETPGGPAKAGSDSATGAASGQDPAASTAVAPVAPVVAPVVPAAELNGGSIPAPAQRDS
ncbi:hypothetical protein [Arthrobacter sp. 35W]|uniref:hypothetical protein n=1 Tax=Arthrobacter sp. 35W TaxID=1132441 RepID=UPI000424C3DD|nr:hypothetical protein [Arthrobacter sp. 35W]